MIFGRQGGPFREAARDNARRERRFWLRRVVERLAGSLARTHDESRDPKTGRGGR
ncbi:MAG TPA: hypothetical protein VMC79_10160 [Rectinemataceae bacterium]|nr:hypothetical protein [Rectinemataceae bacterium]